MKIQIKKGNRSYGIKIPLGVIKLIPSSIVNHSIAGNGNNQHASDIDFRQVKKAIHMLKEYKGLKIIDVQSSCGEGFEVTI